MKPKYCSVCGNKLKEKLEHGIKILGCKDCQVYFPDKRKEKTNIKDKEEKNKGCGKDTEAWHNLNNKTYWKCGESTESFLFYCDDCRKSESKQKLESIHNIADNYMEKKITESEALKKIREIVK